MGFFYVWKYEGQKRAIDMTLTFRKMKIFTEVALGYNLFCVFRIHDNN